MTFTAWERASTLGLPLALRWEPPAPSLKGCLEWTKRTLMGEQVPALPPPHLATGCWQSLLGEGCLGFP